MTCVIHRYRFTIMPGHEQGNSVMSIVGLHEETGDAAPYAVAVAFFAPHCVNGGTDISGPGHRWSGKPTSSP